jgi:hypothetical protein
MLVPLLAARLAFASVMCDVMGMQVAQQVAKGRVRRRKASEKMSSAQVTAGGVQITDQAASKQAVLGRQHDCGQAQGAPAAEQGGAAALNLELLEDRNEQAMMNAMPPDVLYGPENLSPDTVTVCSWPACTQAALSPRNCIRAACDQVSTARSVVACGLLPFLKQLACMCA